jgi:tetratricopeptide (TPR) repeat protein
LRASLRILPRTRGLRRAAAKAGASNAPGGRGLTEEIRRKVLAELYVTAQDSCVGLVTATNPVVPISGGTTEERRATDVLRAASSIADTAALVAYELEVFIDGPPKYSDSGPPGSIAARAAEQWQTQLCMAQNRSSIELWRGYARFCARVGRKEAAEEALQHIICNKAQAAESSITATEDNPEVDCAHPDVMKRFLQNAEKERRAEACDLILNYAMLLLDRERYVEAERACRAVLDMDRSDPMHNLGYALMLWLRNMAGQGEAEDLENVKKFASLARKPLDFFKGLTHGTDKQLFDKLRLFDRDEVSDSEEEKNLPTLLLVPSPEEIAGCRFARVLIEYGAPRLALEMLAQEAPREGYPSFPVLAQHTKVSCPLVAHLRARSAMRQRDWPKARSMAKDLVYAKYVDDDGAHTSPQLWADYAECLYWLGEDPAPAAVKVIDTVESLLPPEFVEPPSPVPGCRAGFSFMDRGDLRESMRQFQVSIRVEPTAIAWYGLAMAAYRSGEDAVSFEALTECTLRNSDHPETFALLALWHCRAGTIELAKHAFVTMMEKPATPDLDLLIEVGWAMLGAYVPFAFAAGRRALSLRDEGQGHFLLGEAWVADGQPAQGVLEMAIAVGMFWEDTDTRQKVYDRALEVCEALQDAPLRESVNFSMRKADEKLAAFREEEERQRRRANEKKAREEEA